METLLTAAVCFLMGWILKGKYEDYKMTKLIEQVQAERQAHLDNAVKVYLSPQESGLTFMYEEGTDKFLFVVGEDKSENIRELKKAYPNKNVMMSREDAEKLGL